MERIWEEIFFLQYHLRMSRDTILEMSKDERKWMIENFKKAKKMDD